MKKVAFLFMLCSINLVAQKYELGKVSVQELEEKFCPIDSSAVAAVLFSTGESHFDYVENKGFVLSTNVKTKIKIYKKEGYEWANKSVQFYIGGNNKEGVSFKNEATYNLVNGKVEKTKLKSDGVFDEKVNDFWGRKKITLPNVKVGSIIEFEYTLTSENFGSLDEWYFQESIPVLHSEYKTYIPDFYVFKPIFKGFIQPKMTQTDKLVTITSIARDRMTGSNRTNSAASLDQSEYKEIKTTYVLENAPALKEEAYVNNIKNYISSVVLELSGIRKANMTFKDYSTTWESLVKDIYKNENFGNELNKTGYYDKDIDAVLAKTNSEEEKIAAIFAYVKSTMNWNKYYGYYCNDGVRKAYLAKTGNVAEINLMLTSMLRYAGFDANPVILSTRGNGISIFPARTAFDYVIAGVQYKNQTILLDATSKYSLPSVLPIRDLNWYGRLIRKDESSSQIDLMPTSNSKEIINLMAEINAQGEVSGKARDQYMDYNAFVYRDNFNGLNNESRIEKIEKSHPGLEILTLEVLNSDDLSKPIVENYSFSSNNQVEIIGDKMYFSPLLHFTMKENPFKQEQRLYPIDFVFPHQDKYSISIKIPDGYVVETLPSSKAIGMTENKAVYKYTISNTGSQIQLMYTFDVNTAIIGSEDYEEVKAFYKDMVEKHTEKVVLKRG